jgi:hypothetical protein
MKWLRPTGTGQRRGLLKNVFAARASGAFAFALGASAKPRRSPKGGGGSPARQVGMLRPHLGAAGVSPRGTDAPGTLPALQASLEPSVKCGTLSNRASWQSWPPV